jgi:RecA-family ATPase
VRRVVRQEKRGMVGLLTTALEYAARGWPVFPCRPGGKTPMTEHGFKDANTDPAVIKRWWKRWPDANPAIATGKESGIVVWDFDVKRGAPGRETFARLEREHGPLETAMYQTPTGGCNAIFGYVKSGNRTNLLPGLDIRGDGGYIVAPGSRTVFDEANGTVDGEYTWLNALPPAPLPEGLKDLLLNGKSHAAGDAASGIMFDRCVVLQGVPEGQRDDTLFRYACSLKARRTPRQEAEVLVRAAAASCIPPFPEDIALEKIARIYQQALADDKSIGWQTPEPISVEEWQTARLTPACIVQDYLFADVAVKVAPGGTGKTTLQLFEAIHIALGRPLYGLEIRKPGPVAILTAEDSREMLVARLRRIAEAMALRPAEIERVQRQVRIADLCGAGVRLTEIIDDVVRPAGLVDALADGLADLAPVLVTIDPAVSFGVGESRVNDAEQGLVEAARRLRRALNCCIRYVHHSGKQSARDKTTDQYTGRGGSAFADGARMVHVLQPINAGEWLRRTGEALAAGASGLVLARPKMSYCPPQGEILLRRHGYLFEPVEPADTDPVAALRRDGDGLLAIMRDLDYPTQNTVESMDTGLGRNRTRAVISYLMDSGRVESRDKPGKKSRKGGAQKYLYIVPPLGAPVSDPPTGAPSDVPTNSAGNVRTSESAFRCAAAYRDGGGGAPTAAPPPPGPSGAPVQGGAPTAHLAHLTREVWEGDL